MAAKSWQRQYELTMALHVEAAEAAYLSGNFEEMEQLVKSVIENARTLLDKVKAYESKIQAYFAQNRLLESVQAAIPVLRLLGVTFPKKPNKYHILWGLLTTKLALAGKQIEELINLPEMIDPHSLAIMQILVKMSTAAYTAIPELLPLVGCKGVRVSRKHGNTGASVYIAGHGLILSVFVGDIVSGYHFGKLALRLLAGFPNCTIGM